MWTRTGKEIISAPHIFHELKPIFDEFPEFVFDGELYTSNKDVDFNTIISCVRKTKPTFEDISLSEEYIEYWCYDSVNCENGLNDIFHERQFVLLDIRDKFLSTSKKIKILDSYVVRSHGTIEQMLQQYLEEGYEGGIIRSNTPYENKRTSALLKHKEFKDEEFTILSVNEGIGKYAGCAATVTVDVNGVNVDCTINGTMEYLAEVLGDSQKYIGKQATIKYFEKTPDGSLRFPKAIQLDRDGY